MSPPSRQTPVRCAVVNPIATGGGVTESFFNSLTMLRRGGVEPIPIVAEDFRFLDRLGQEGFAPLTVQGLARRGWLALPGQVWRLARTIRASGADLVLVNNGRHVAALKRLLDVPLVAVFHGGKIGRFLSADRVITINEPQRDALIGAGYSSDRVEVVDNVLPFETLPPLPKRTWPADPVIGTLRLLEPAKGVDILIEAVALLAGEGRRVRTRIGSTGSQEADLRALARRRNVADLIEFCGWIEDRDAFYANLDLYVLPSRHEEWGIGIAEAYAAGLPVVSTACLGPLRIVEDGVTGLLVPTERPDALAAAIRRLLDDGALARRLAAAGYRRCAETYTLAAIGPRYVAGVLAALPQLRRP